MKKRLLTVLIITFCFMFGLSFSAYACHFDNVVLEADCEGYSITGQLCADAYYHPVVTVKYSFSLNKDGQIIDVSGEVEVEPDFVWSCEVGFEDSGSWGELCGENITINGDVELYSGEWLHDNKTFEEIVLVCPCNVGCNRTPGYWKNHPEAWPVDEITIGGVTYTKDEAIASMEMPVAGDKTYTMFDALVAAKLNVLVGSDDSCISSIMAAADAWMAGYGPVGSGVDAGGDDSPWRMGEPLYETLDQYNNGELCVPECE